MLDDARTIHGRRDRDRGLHGIDGGAGDDRWMQEFGHLELIIQEVWVDAYDTLPTPLSRICKRIDWKDRMEERLFVDMWHGLIGGFRGGMVSITR